ncbi:MAG: hypothetical protein ACIAS6_05330 [Phycisphaerales bacterium JB060]
MSAHRFTPEHDLPRGVSEADLLDWVEADAGQLTSPSRGSSLERVAEARANDPGLASLLDAMRVDRAALGSLDIAEPSESIAQAVLDEHERQALLALSDLAAGGPGNHTADSSDDAFSFSAMPGWFKPALAVAALLALAFGAWQLIPFAMPETRIEQGPAVATTDGEDQPNTVSPLSSPPLVAEESTVIAEARPTPTLRPPRERAPSSADLLAGKLDLPVGEAIARAAEGRLMIVVSVPDSRGVSEAVVRLSQRPIQDTWRVRAASDQLVAAMTTPQHARLVDLDGVGEGPLSATARGPLGQLEVVMAAAPMVYMGEASTSADALLGLVEVLDHLGENVRVIALDAPLPGAGTIPAPATEGMLLWWERDPATWQPWAAIPIRFVESR